MFLLLRLGLLSYIDIWCAFFLSLLRVCAGVIVSMASLKVKRGSVSVFAPFKSFPGGCCELCIYILLVCLLKNLLLRVEDRGEWRVMCV